MAESETGDREAYWTIPSALRLQLLAAPDADGVYHSRTLPGFWLNVSWLWSEPIPRADVTMARIGDHEYVSQLAREMQTDFAGSDTPGDKQ